MATANRTGTPTYSAEPRTATSTTTRTEKGISLARGPALILGTLLLAVGLYLLYKARTFPPFSNFPNGHVARDGNFLFGIFGANGWTGMLTAVGGGLLLFGAAQHLLAKTMSLIVGIALGAAAVIAVVSGNVLGMAAANSWTKLGWAVAAAILLFNTLIPRRKREVVVADEPVRRDGAAAYDRRPVAADEGTAARRDESEPTVVHRQDEANPAVADRHDEANSPVVDRQDEANPAVVDRQDDANSPVVDRQGEADPTVVRRDSEPTVVHREGESTVAHGDDEPAAIRRD
ncbi:MAG: hypothetical protein WAU75_20725 [Solirubrobacteraceae bacterium]